MLSTPIPFLPKLTMELCLFLTKVPAGFPSPTDDYLEATLDLNEYLVKHPAATFMVRVKGDSMRDAHILENDLLVIDRSIAPVPGKIVIAVINGELTVKRLHKTESGTLILRAENPHYPDITLNPEAEIHIWGVVVHIIHSV